MRSIAFFFAALSLCAVPCRSSLSGRVFLADTDEEHASLAGHVVRATNGRSVLHAVANRDGYFEFLNLSPGDWWLSSDMTGYKTAAAVAPFATLHADSTCMTRDLPLRRFGRREQIEEAMESLPGYALALYQIIAEAWGAKRR